jgi:hypothetical protein
LAQKKKINKSLSAQDRDAHKNYMYRQQAERRRERDNWRCYEATYFGQWNEQNIQQAVQEGRPLSSYNIAKKSIDTVVGSVIADPFELHYDTELGDSPQTAILMNELFMEDKDLTGFDLEYQHFVRGGFVFRSIMEIYVNRERSDRMPRVGWRNIAPDRIVFDPDWRTNDIDDNRSIYIHAWMGPQQIKDKYDKSSREIEAAIKVKEDTVESSIKSESTEADEISKLYDSSPEYFDEKNDQYLVIDKYWLKTTTHYEVYEPAAAAVLATLPYEKALELKAIYEEEGRETMLLPVKKRELWVRTTIPGLSLSLVLQEGRHELQLNGYPFVIYSSDVINGKPNTYMDILKDPQIVFNKRINTETHILMTQSNNTLFIEEDAVEGDASEVDKIGKGRNRPGAYFRVSPGAKDKIWHLERGSPPTDFLNSASYIRDIMREITPAVPAMQATGEKESSGVLFQSRVQQAMIALQMPTKLLQAVWERMGELYFRAVKQIYTYPMEFQSSRTGEIFFLNTPGGIDISTINRLKVVITQSPKSETYRRRLIQNYLAIAQYLQDPYTLAALSRIVVGNLPDIPEAELDQLREAAKLSEEAQKVALEAQVASVQGQMMQGGMGPPGSGMPGQGQANAPAPGSIDSEGLLQSVVQNVQNNRRGQPNAPITANNLGGQ